MANENIVIDTATGRQKVAVAGGGAGGTLAFEWNGSDTSQFDLGTVYSGGGSLGPPTLAVVADATLPGGNRLVMSQTGLGEGYGVILVVAPLSSQNFIIEMDVEAVGSNGQGLAFYAEDSAGLYAYCMTYGAVATAWNINAGVASVFSATGTVPLVADTAGRALLSVRGDKPGTGGPRGMAVFEGGYANFGAKYTKRIRADFPSPAIGWKTLSANRWGLALYGGSNGTAGPLTVSGLRAYVL